MAPLPVTFSDLECHFFLFDTVLYHVPLEIQRMLSTICLHLHHNAHVASNSKYLLEKPKTSKSYSQSRTL